MPSEDAVVLYKTKYNDSLTELSQQVDSRLVSVCKQITGVPEFYTHERIGKARMRKRNGRVEQATFDSINYDRRRLRKDHFVANLPVDEWDIEDSNIDMTSSNVQALRYAMVRKIDQIIAEAALADVVTGKDGETTISAATDGVLTVTATGGMGLDDILAINRNFVDNEVGIRGSNTMPARKILAITGEEEEDLLNVAQLTSGDYDRRYQLERGELQFVCGLEIVKFGGFSDDPILVVTGGLRKCLAIAQDGILVGWGTPETTEVKERVDYEGVWQAKGKMSVGAVRLEGVKVQHVSTTD